MPESKAVPFYRLLCGVCREPMVAMQAGSGPDAQFALACPADEPSHFAVVMSVEVSSKVFRHIQELRDRENVVNH